MSQHTILLVEDNEDNRYIYSSLLRHVGFVVIEAVDGAEGVRQALAHRPDLILMDIQLPVMSGWDAARAINRDQSMAGTPILALSAFDCDRSAEGLAEAGFHAWLKKPIAPSSVLQSVREIFGGGG